MFCYRILSWCFQMRLNLVDNFALGFRDKCCSKMSSLLQQAVVEALKVRGPRRKLIILIAEYWFVTGMDSKGIYVRKIACFPIKLK